MLGTPRASTLRSDQGILKLNTVKRPRAKRAKASTLRSDQGILKPMASARPDRPSSLRLNPTIRPGDTETVARDTLTTGGRGAGLNPTIRPGDTETRPWPASPALVAPRLNPTIRPGDTETRGAPGDPGRRRHRLNPESPRFL